jgi:hypothetical protein
VSSVKLLGQTCNMLYVFGGNQVYLIFNAKSVCCVKLLCELMW